MSQSKMSNLVSYNLFAHASSGSAASCVALITAFPFLTVLQRKQLDDLKQLKDKNTFQLIQHLIKTEGFSTLYRGLVPVLQSSCISNFVYFYVFHLLKSLRTKKVQSAAGDLVIGALAGVVNVLLTTPCWVVNTRIKMKGITSDLPYSNLISGLRYIARNEGVKKLWSGTCASLILVANPSIQFSVYESIKRHLIEIYGKETPTFLYFLAGAAAKLVATILTYPVQIIQTKLRHGDNEFKKNLPPNAGTLEMILYILKIKGINGLYCGLEAKLWQTVLTAALMFMTYEKIVRFVKIILRASASAK